MSYTNEIPWEVIRSQRTFFESGVTRSIDFRKTQLRRLLKLLDRHEADILDALKKDLKKHPGRVRLKVVLVDQAERLMVQMKTTEKGFEMNDEMTEFLEMNPLIDVQVDTL